MKDEKKNGCIRQRDEYILKTYNGEPVTVRQLQLEILDQLIYQIKLRKYQKFSKKN